MDKFTYELYLSKDQIEDIVADMASEVDAYCTHNKITDLLVLGVMNGALFFVSDLLKQVHTDVELHTIRTKSYYNNSNENSTLTCLGLEYVPLKDRTILIVDDVYDSGQTLDWLRETLLQLGAKQVLSCVLINKVPGHPNKVANLDFVGHIMTKKEFLVGYGMDDNGYCRNLTDIVIKKEVTK